MTMALNNAPATFTLVSFVRKFFRSWNDLGEPSVAILAVTCKCDVLNWFYSRPRDVIACLLCPYYHQKYGSMYSHWPPTSQAHSILAAQMQSQRSPATYTVFVSTTASALQ